MGIEVNGTMIQKGLETMANITKTAANVTENAGKQEKKTEKREYREHTNQPHNQTVEVKVGQQESNPKPVVIKEKPETHIHKQFPDNRALTADECTLALKIKEMELADVDKERHYRLVVREQDYKERQERIEYERKQNERRKAEAAKQRKVRNIIGGTIGVALLGAIAYACYADYRDSKTRGSNLQADTTTTPKLTDGAIAGNGTVK